ncbi:MAG: hypothetical protein U0Q16_15985 [Bryobacteraceae bacterium]
MNPSLACPSCQAGTPPGSRRCPICGALIFAEQLKILAGEAQSFEQQGQVADALRRWREALGLLPTDAPQYATIAARVTELSTQADRADATATEASGKSGWAKKAAGPASVLGALAWKFKGALLLVASKGKLLLFGFSKLGTLSTMFVSFGAYWALYGWPFALGLVLSIYVHEMGHIWEARRLGIPTTAPAFIPLMGAFIGLKSPVNPVEDARIGLGGPRWGSGAAIAALVLYWLTAAPVMLVIAHFGAVVNLFNLIPIWTLDGARATRALSRAGRIAVAVALFVSGILSGEGMFFLVALGSAWRCFTKDTAEENDTRTLIEFLGLIAVIAIIAAAPVPQTVQ